MSIKEFVVFKLETEHYGIDINYVENIEKVLHITRVPHTKPYIRGVVNLRGNVIPVIDLRERFGLENKDILDETRIIIVNVNELKIGMIVDSSSEVLQLDTENIDEAPMINSNVSEEFVKYVGKNNERIVMLIDLIKVLGIQDLIEN